MYERIASVIYHLNGQRYAETMASDTSLSDEQRDSAVNIARIHGDLITKRATALLEAFEHGGATVH